MIRVTYLQFLQILWENDENITRSYTLPMI